MPVLTFDSRDDYPVEVSGWDRYENFFVEKTELHWSEHAEKQILLQRDVPAGTVLFLRLLDPLGEQRANPVPYRAERIDPDGVEPGWLRLIPARLGSESRKRQQ